MAAIQMAQRNQGRHSLADSSSSASPVTALTAPSVHVDNREVMEAIQHLSTKLDRFLTVDHEQIERIQVEISDIAGRIKATKLEMAALRHPLSNEDKFQEASEQLMAVVRATEVATNSIIGAVEQIEDIVDEVRSQLPEGGYQHSRLKDLSEATVRIFEACNFQDLTGQRITKVVQALAFIEERVESMMSVWNQKEFEALPLPPSIHKTDGGLELHGPSSESQSISQADIDALFD